MTQSTQGMFKSKDAVVVLSGGQDSTTCLFWAKREFRSVHAITFDYGQRHRTELEAARVVAKMAEVTTHRESTLTEYKWLAESSLTRDVAVSATGGGLDGSLPNTFTPGRNLVMGLMAAVWAYGLRAPNMVLGVCQTDYSGYPDCRAETMRSMEKMIRDGMAWPDFTVHTPLMFLTKAETVQMARGLSGCWEALAETVTCYHGQRPGCGECPSCLLRKKGFAEAGEVDPSC